MTRQTLAAALVGCALAAYGCCFIPAAPTPSTNPLVAPSGPTPGSAAVAPPAGAVAPAAPARDFDYIIGDTFRLGDFDYRISSSSRRQRIGTRYAREESAPGSTFLVVDYSETNQGRETFTGAEGPMALADDRGRRFRPSSRAMTALAISGQADLALTQLQPGVPREGHVAFEIPDDPNLRLVLIVEQRGFGSSGEARVLLQTAAEHRMDAILDAIVFPYSTAARTGDTGAARTLYAPEVAPSDELLRAELAAYQSAVGTGNASVPSDVPLVDGAYELSLRLLDTQQRTTGRTAVFRVTEIGGVYRLLAVRLPGT